MLESTLRALRSAARKKAERHRVFTNTIHTDPGQLTRVQVGKKNPVAGVNVVCMSGMVSRAKCSISVISHDCAAGGAGDVTANLTLGR